MDKKLDYNKFHYSSLNAKQSYLNVEEKLEEIKKFVLKNVSKNAKILELGAGSGFFSNWLYYQGFTNVIASDLSNVAISLIKKRFPYLQVSQTDAENIKLNSNFDVIIALDVVEHLDDVAHHLNQIHKVLNSNGIYIIKTPNKFWEDIYYKKILLRKDKNKKYTCLNGHPSSMTFRLFKKKLLRAGFTLEFIRQRRLTEAQEKKIKLICPYFFAMIFIDFGNLILKIVPKRLNIQFICIAKKYV